MVYKLFYCLMFIALLLAQVPRAAAVTTDELAGIIEQMETAIVDISVEYEWRIIPTPTPEEGERKAGFRVLATKDGYKQLKFSASNLLPDSDPNRLDWKAPGKLVKDMSCTIINGEGNSWAAVTKQSYNGQIGKSLTIGGWPKEIRSATVSYNKPYVHGNLTPLGFSVLRLAYRQESVPLSARLLSYRLRLKDEVQLDNVPRKVDGFNTVRTDLLTSYVINDGSRLVYMRVYFSVDHGYTPVRFESMKGRNKVGSSTSVESLDEVAEGVWFPSSGIITSHDSGLINAYQAIGPILVNQNLKNEHFDIEFPVGTKVHDKIQGRKYVIK